MIQIKFNERIDRCLDGLSNEFSLKFIHKTVKLIQNVFLVLWYMNASNILNIVSVFIELYNDFPTYDQSPIVGQD